MPILPYAHQKINEKKFIYPITGLDLSTTHQLTIGKVTFISKEHFWSNVLDKELVEILNTKGIYSNTPTFAIVDLTNMGDIEDICTDGNNSIAMQLLKQTIGALYISIYSIKPTPDDERRIVISDVGIHEVDEGLNTYLVWYQGRYTYCQNEVKHYLVANSNDFCLKEIEKFIHILSKPMSTRNEYESKISKALEILYSTLNEPYTRERVIKLSIMLNFIFRDNGDANLEITHIAGKLRVIFNIIQPKLILEAIPNYICSGKTTKKISATVIDIYSRIRNEVMHGRVDLQTEYAICNIDDYICLKVIVMETLLFMVTELINEKCIDTASFNCWIDEENAKYIKYKQDEKKAKGK